MIDTDKYEGQIEFDEVLKEIEVGVDISEGNYDILRYYRDEYKDLLAEVKRLRVIEEQRRRMGNVLADYCIEDVCDEFFEGDYSFYERLVKAYGWKEGDEE